MSVYERLMFQALGGRPEFWHRWGKENKSVTYVQSLLDSYTSRNSNDPKLIGITDFQRFMPRKKFR